MIFGLLILLFALIATRARAGCAIGTFLHDIQFPIVTTTLYGIGECIVMGSKDIPGAINQGAVNITENAHCTVFGSETCSRNGTGFVISVQGPGVFALPQQNARHARSYICAWSS
ncbi:hypothetical protein EJ04DRAFT_555817 [Polyplosphaeria fusca]|uniref:Secreted protein n=1 Tax=Polyplosphaeria fusca TaxID=682080 RepID=A0A9P4QP27_9PLEO|nr:hypothetical protein EJ04DRAFT_555817 [Polyplosphaeria fusca]